MSCRNVRTKVTKWLPAVLAVGLLPLAGFAQSPTPSDDLESRVQALEVRVADIEAAGDSRPASEPPQQSTSTQNADRFLGNWKNVDDQTRGLPRLEITHDNQQALSIRAWGSCSPTDCDWGEVPLALLGDSAGATELPYGFCQWDHGFTDNYMTLRVEDNELAIEVYDIFKDGSGRSNYRAEYRFRRGESGSGESSDAAGQASHEASPVPRDALKISALAGQELAEVQKLVRPMTHGASYAGDESLAVFFVFGSVDGGSTLVQASWDGRVLGSMLLPHPLSGIAADTSRLLGTVGSSRVGDGRVVSIDGQGLLQTVFRDPSLLPDTINIWSLPDSKEFLVVDNGADVVLAISKTEPQKTDAKIRLNPPRDNFQSMSTALCVDGSVLFSSDDPSGVYRVSAGAGTDLGQPLLTDQAAVAAHPTTPVWVAAAGDTLHVFEGEREIKQLTYPGGLMMFRPNIDFAPDGTLILALHGAGQDHFFAVDLETGKFQGLFTVAEDRITGTTVAPRMEWGGNADTSTGSHK